MEWLALEIALALAAGTLSAFGRAGRVAGRATSVLAASCAFGPEPEAVQLRALLALGGPWIIMQNIRLGRTTPSQPLLLRLWQSLATLDVRRVARVSPSIDRRLLARVAILAPIFAACFYGSFTLSKTLPWPRTFAWAFGTVGVYACADLVAALLVLGHGLIGLRIPKIHDDPILSKSVMEFWGQRWNRIVGDWLFENAFLPLARRRRPFLGIAASFLISAALHFHLIFVPLGLEAALTMGTFFVLQIPLIALERKLKLGRRPVWVSRAWTLGSLVCLSPLFVEPFLALAP
ncbi:MAG: hypothetical protein HYV07_23950 [Deltaproteobacteria bacterium]|nr:hypothetical protein [Deltaproteobacteria bacterium]